MSDNDIDHALAALVKDAFPEPVLKNSLLPGVERRIRRRRRRVVAAAITLVVAAVCIPVALLHGEDSARVPGHSHSSTPEWADRCFQSWNKRPPIPARPDTRPDGLSSGAVAAFAHSRGATLAVIAKNGKCIDDWFDYGTQAHLPAYLFAAFDPTGHVAAAWFMPGRGGVITRPAR